MKKIEFWKMSGSGNDFVVIDNRRAVIRGRPAAWARRLCHRQEGVGADGLLLLERSRRAAFRMLYYNADGSRASMCGNGARCIAWAADAWGVARRAFDFETDAGIVHGEVDGTVVRITLADPRDYRPDAVLRAGGKTWRVGFVNTGVPHAVVAVRDAGRVNLPGDGPLLRHHRAFGAPGANVNFVQRLGPRSLRVRTYERGVEGETLACGTGVSASAIVSALQGRVKPPVRCLTAGGDTLEVDFELNPGDRDRPARRVTLRGPVRRTFVGQVESA